jgi:hypothetical protein
VVGKPGVGGLGEAVAAGLPDGGAAAGVFVVGGDVADAGVQSSGVVLVLDDDELGAQDGGVGDRQQVGPFPFGGAVERFDPGLVGRGRGAPEMLGRWRPWP